MEVTMSKLEMTIADLRRRDRAYAYFGILGMAVGSLTLWELVLGREAFLDILGRYFVFFGPVLLGMIILAIYAVSYAVTQRIQDPALLFLATATVPYVIFGLNNIFFIYDPWVAPNDVVEVASLAYSAVSVGLAANWFFLHRHGFKPVSGIQNKESSMGCLSCGYDNLSEARFCGNCGAALAVTDDAPLVATMPRALTAGPELLAEPKGFWIRFVAWIIDGFFLMLLWWVLITFTFLPHYIDLPHYMDYPPIRIYFWLFTGVYFWLFTGLKGQTPGKMVVGIKVVDRHGNVPGLGRAAIREILGKTVSAIVLLLGFLWVIWDEKKQGWHDKIAGTSVIGSREKEARPWWNARIA